MRAGRMVAIAAMIVIAGAVTWKAMRPEPIAVTLATVDRGARDRAVEMIARGGIHCVFPVGEEKVHALGGEDVDSF